MVNGNNILIYATYNGSTQAVAATRSLSVQVGAEMIEIASPDSGEWRAYLAVERPTQIFQLCRGLCHALIEDFVSFRVLDGWFTRL